MPITIGLLAAALWLLIAAAVLALLVDRDLAVVLVALAVVFGGLGAMAYEEGL